MEITLDFIIAFIGVIGAVIGVALYNERRLNKIALHSEERFNVLENRMTSIETKIIPFWDTLKSNMPILLSNIVKNPQPLKESCPEKMSKAQLEGTRDYLKRRLGVVTNKSDIILAISYINMLLAQMK